MIVTLADPVESADPVLAKGTRVGDFQIRRLLGEGAMGQVYLARDTTLGRRVALKLLKRSVLQRHGAERLLAEARATASFNHPNIVTLYAVGEHDGRPYLALEYIDGESLRARIAGGPLPMQEALRCCRAVAQAMEEAHQRGLVHSDLKPDNIVVPRDGRVRVVDFGLAKLAGRFPNSASGTPAYMAPERWRGAPPTGAIDIWSLGVTLHELITGRRPIPDREVIHLMFTAGALELPGLPDASWAQLVRDCLALDPAARPSAEQVQRRLTALLDPHATPAHESHKRIGAQTPNRMRRRPRNLSADTFTDSRRVIGRVSEESCARHPRLVFSARNAGAPDDAWLVPVVERMVRRTFRDRLDPRCYIVEGGDDATRIDLTVSREREQIRIDALDAASAQVLASASGSSVAGAVRALVEVLGSKLGEGLETVGPDVEELEEMHLVGATSVELFRRYRRVLHTHLATSRPDLSAHGRAVRGIIAEDPAWAHPYALLATIEGWATEAARDALAAGRSDASAERDPSGIQLIGAIELAARGDPEAAFHAASVAFSQPDADLLAGVLLESWAMGTLRSEEGLAITQRLHARFPELLFGMDLAGYLRLEARDGDADRVIREWVAAAPESLLARVELVRIEANAGRFDEALARTREVVVIHGDRDDALPELFEAFVATDQISSGRAIADRMLAGSPPIRAYGRYRVAVTSVLEGRFAAAYDAVRRAITEHRAFGMRSELSQCLELARSIAPLVADVHAQRRYTGELADVLATMIGDAGAAAATRFELALLDRGGAAPSIDDHLVGLEDGPMRDSARRRMLRAAALAGCGSVSDAVAAGFSSVEENTAALVAFGLCARRAGELELARRSLELATRQWTSIVSNQSSPYHAVLARFHLADVLVELGEHARARTAYESFLRCWSSPDRPIPEVVAARKALEAG